MRMLPTFICLVISYSAWSHVPALLLPIKGTPITSYYIGQSDISRALYSELTQADDYLVVQFYVNTMGENSIELLTPVCQKIPSYEDFQPSVLILKGDVPWKINGESSKDFISRVEKMALGKAESNYAKGQRPQFYEEFGKQNYWVGGKLRMTLQPGLYALLVYNKTATKGNFTLGINEKEIWTPDLYRYVGEVLPKITAGICDPKGFSGSIAP
jgi:hypothetical protein